MTISSTLAEQLDQPLTLSHAIGEKSADAGLRCPVCRGPLDYKDDGLRCGSSRCGKSFPIVDGVPVLINESRSLFRIEEVVAGHSKAESRPTLRARIASRLPQIGRNHRAVENLRLLRDELLRRPEDARRVLIIGGGIVGYGVQALIDEPSIELVETDVYFGPRARYIVDAHDLPFADESFDAVVIQGVLGALLDPGAAIVEIIRVLQRDGLVYAETPFVQQVCMGRFDFQRYSHLGLRRLFRQFDEIRSGAQAGPAMALAWSYQYLLWSFVRSRTGRSVMMALARCTAWWLPRMDRLLLDRPGAIDGASGVFFLGRKAATPLSDRELIASYRGAFS